MRALLEFFGIVQPRHHRREPVALPAWARRVGPALVISLSLASMLLFALLRALLG